ncbi:MAG: hydroxyacylglutathione hydrolase [Pseudomonadota bacterium]
MIKNEHGPLTVVQFPCLDDNYAFLLRDETSGKVAAVDTPDADAIARELDRLGWNLDYILNTHWHADHVGGNEALKAHYGAEIIAPHGEGEKIAHKDRMVKEGDEVALGDLTARVIETPGHTLGHVIYVFDDQKVVFVADTVFSLGCGRMFEGTPEVFWQSLDKIRALPVDTILYCAHEYSAANAAFAVTVEPDNPSLQTRVAEIKALREEGKATVPIRLGDELETNPFLRADVPAVAANMGLPDAEAYEVFGEVRRRKDNF